MAGTRGGCATGRVCPSASVSSGPTPHPWPIWPSNPASAAARPSRTSLLHAALSSSCGSVPSRVGKAGSGRIALSLEARATPGNVRDRCLRKTFRRAQIPWTGTSRPRRPVSEACRADPACSRTGRVSPGREAAGAASLRPPHRQRSDGPATGAPGPPGPTVTLPTSRRSAARGGTGRSDRRP